MSDPRVYLLLSPDEAADLAAAADHGWESACVDKDRMAELIYLLEQIAYADE